MVPPAAVPSLEQNRYYSGKRRIARFADDLDDIAAVEQYFRNHAIRMLAAGVRWSGIVEPLYDTDAGDDPSGDDGGKAWGGVTTFEFPDPDADAANGGYRVGHSVFVLTWARGKGRMKRWLARHPDAVMVTADTCDLSQYFQRRRRKHWVYEVPSALQPAYGLAARYYGDRVTDRTGVHMINHIDEGLWVLERIGASDDARRAYAIHPPVMILQRTLCRLKARRCTAMGRIFIPAYCFALP